MPKHSIVNVECQCGQQLARYEKDAPGHLVKMYLRNILIDRAGVFLVEPPLEVGAQIFCPSCEKRVATVQMIHGQPAAKMNQGAIRPINT